MASHSLLQWGIGIFVCGLAIRLAGGEPWSAVALGVQILSKYQAKYRKKPKPEESPQVRRDAEMPPRCRREARCR